MSFADRLKCGEIVLQKDGLKFSSIQFCCEFCGMETHKLTIFLKHTLMDHMSMLKEEITALMLSLVSDKSADIPKKNTGDVNSIEMLEADREAAIDQQSEYKNCQEKDCEVLKEIKVEPVAEDYNNETDPSKDFPAFTMDTGANDEEDASKSFEIEFVSVNKNTIRRKDDSKRKKTRVPLEQWKTCGYCNKKFPSEFEFERHEKKHIKSHVCDICGSAFADISNMKVHRLRHLGIKQYKCSICNKQFITSTELRLHFRSHTGEKPYKCESCDKSFSNSSALSEHRRRHRKERTYVCTTCGKGFFTLGCLRGHETSHSNLRPFVCGVCNMDFPRRKALRTHEKLHSDVKEYKCKICSKEFAQNAGLFSHMKSHKKKNEIDTMDEERS